jgi:hypothetical protein
MASRSAAKAKTTERGLGYHHRQHVAALFRNLIDGTLCWWCGQPMYADDGRNWDGRKLRGDHSVPRAIGGNRADRLLHATCNEQRQDGRRDHLRPALTGMAADLGKRVADVGARLMAWP